MEHALVPTDGIEHVVSLSINDTASTQPGCIFLAGHRLLNDKIFLDHRILFSLPFHRNQPPR